MFFFCGIIIRCRWSDITTKAMRLNQLFSLPKYKVDINISAFSGLLKNE
jgi:hypothetical protein